MAYGVDAYPEPPDIEYPDDNDDDSTEDDDVEEEIW